MADCDDPRCPGWFVNADTDAIERCDTCQQFSDDYEAADHVRGLYERELEENGKKLGICEHEPNWSTARQPDGVFNHDGIIDVQCGKCGKSGSIPVDPKDVNWE
jgi:hypothetical protein